MIFALLFLTSLSMIISRSIHVAANGITSFFFYGWVIFHCVYMCVCVCVCVYRIFIHSSVDGHLGCFHVLDLTQGLSHTWFRWIRWWYFGTLVAAAAAKLLQSCPTLCDPIDGSPPGSAIPGIPQARTLEWVELTLYRLNTGLWFDDVFIEILEDVGGETDIFCMNLWGHRGECSRIMPSPHQTCPFLIPRTYAYSTLHGEKDFVDVIKLRILRWETTVGNPVLLQRSYRREAGWSEIAR